MIRVAAARYPDGENARIAATIDALTAERDSLDRTKLQLSSSLFDIAAERDRYREALARADGLLSACLTDAMYGLHEAPMADVEHHLRRNQPESKFYVALTEPEHDDIGGGKCRCGVDGCDEPALTEPEEK